jgi:threonine aldolase
MEAALYCASGTQTNQIAINIHVQPGGEVICNKESHVFKYEGGGIARNAGASVRLIRGNQGKLIAQDVVDWVNPQSDVHLPLTALVSIEDTMNRGGGTVYDFEEIKRIRKVCQANGLPLHLDGARVFNALAVNGIDAQTYGAEFDSISICLSKGLGAPVGSVLIGSREFITKARRVRKVFGGGMRQAGIIAAGGLFALKYHVHRLVDDHARAKRLEAVLNDLNWVERVISVETNIVVAVLKDADSQLELLGRLKDNGVLAVAFGKGMIRFVTHLDIHDQDIDRCIEVLRSL